MVVGFVYCFCVNDPVDGVDDAIDVERALSLFGHLVVDVVFELVSEGVEVVPDDGFYFLKLVSINNIEAI